MKSLYVDSSSGLVIGLLDENFKWLEYNDAHELRPSEVIHIEIFNLITKYNLDIKNINFFFSAGPGSYTGMRLGEGLAQVLEWDKHKVYSFLHFDVPAFVGIKNGSWVTNAFKGEVFIYSWDLETRDSHKELVALKDFSIVNSDEVYTISTLEKNFEGLVATKDLIKSHPELIFPKVLQKSLREPPFYFRTLDQEFK